MTTLSPVTQKFVLHWGEMGARWGINRTMAQIHALLFISEKPLHAEEICEVLGVARSNVSTSLRELQNWQVVKITHVMEGFFRNEEQRMDLRHGPVDPPTRPHFAPMEDEFLGDGAESGHFAQFGFNRNYETKPGSATDIPLFSGNLSGPTKCRRRGQFRGIGSQGRVPSLGFIQAGWGLG